MRKPHLTFFLSSHPARIMSIAAAILFVCGFAAAESISNPKASYIDVQQRHRELSHNKDPRIAQAIASLDFCTKLPEVQPPAGRMIIPPHYLSGGHGPINPAEAPVTRVYNNFEHRVTAGMNQWLVTSSKAEATVCAATDRRMGTSRYTD